MSASKRIGLIVPSSNVTMETEIPALLARQEDRLGIPVGSAATATAYDLLNRLGLTHNIANAGRLLRPALSSAPAVRSA